MPVYDTAAKEPGSTRRRFLKATGALGLALGTAAAAPAGSVSLTARQDAARFLAQSTYGGNLALIDQVTAAGPAAWLNGQMNLPAQPFIDEVLSLYAVEDGAPIFSFDWVWWKQALAAPDLVRQRVTFALSQIFVISRQPEEINEDSRAMAAYWDMLAGNAFGNFRDLLLGVALQPSMGIYLSHLHNRRSDPALNRFPDENFAREVMQLFSIGLFELNSDGTERLGTDGQPIPTYGNAEITEMAKIFTGLTLVPENPDEGIQFGDRGLQTRHFPMVMHDPEHEPGTKTLLNGFVVPAGQSGMQDLTMAIDHLFNHPNVGPFIGKHLIRFLVTSNPKPAYVARVSAAFADNGNGVRGDMKAVLRAILLDPEARDPAMIADAEFGKARDPLVRWVQLGRAFNVASPSGEYRHFSGLQWEENLPAVESVFMAQFPFTAPSVFNFFSPTHQPAGVLTSAGLAAPEMEIIHDFTAIATVNAINRAVYQEHYIYGDVFENELPLDLTTEVALAQSGPEVLLDHLDLLLTYGTLSAATRRAILDAINPLSGDPENQTRMAIYLLMISPDYAVQR
ncbi:MAG: DUF1800 family protein [Pseudomonadota bacterium]